MVPAAVSGMVPAAVSGVLPAAVSGVVPAAVLCLSSIVHAKYTVYKCPRQV